MVIESSSPLRISLYGGGTDIPSYFNHNYGITVGFAINIRQKVIVGGESKLLLKDNPFFFKCFTSENVEHIFEGETEGGLGSSASLAVALTQAEFYRLGVPYTKGDIAANAWKTEVINVGLFGGKQDQVFAEVGGFNKLEFTKDKVIVTPLPKKWIEKLYPYMVLLHSGIKRTNPKLQEGLKTITGDQKGYLDSIKALAEESLGVLKKGDIKELGRLLDYSWKLKKLSNKGVSNTKIDELYEYGIELGALGGKVLGSGGGGCLLFLVDPKKQKEFIADMELKHIPFKIDWQGVKTEII